VGGGGVRRGHDVADRAGDPGLAVRLNRVGDEELEKFPAGQSAGASGVLGAHTEEGAAFGKVVDAGTDSAAQAFRSADRKRPRFGSLCEGHLKLPKARVKAAIEKAASR